MTFLQWPIALSELIFKILPIRNKNAKLSTSHFTVLRVMLNKFMPCIPVLGYTEEAEPETRV